LETIIATQKTLKIEISAEISKILIFFRTF
jgi:hypothetical protein